MAIRRGKDSSGRVDPILEKGQSTMHEGDLLQPASEEVRTPLIAWLVVFGVAWYYHVTVAYLTAISFFRLAIAGTVGDAEKALWLANDYLIVIIVLGPAMSRIGDTCGRKWLMLFGSLMGIVSTIIIATASSMNAAIAGSTLFGLSFAQNTNAFAIAAEMVNRHHRATANTIMGIGSASGVIVALYAGAGFITRYPGLDGGYPGWRILQWFYCGQFVTCGVIIGLTYWPVPVPNRESKSVARRIYESCDIIGSLLLAFAITPIILGLVWGGVVYPWRSAAVIAPLVVGCVLLFAWVAYESFIQKEGLIHHGMLQNRNFLIGVYGCAVEGMVYLIFNAFGGIEIESLYESRTILFTARYSAFPIAICVANPLNAYYVYRRKRVLEPLLLGYLLMLGAGIGFACLTPNTSATSTAMLVLAGLGFAGPQTLLTTVTQWAVPREFLGLASAVAQCGRLFGGVIGIAASGALVTSKIKARLPSQIAQAATENGLPSSSLTAFVTAIAGGDAAAAEAIPGVTPTILQAATLAAKNAYAWSYKYVWIFAVPFVFVAVMSVFFLRSVSHVMDGQVDRPNTNVDRILEQERAELRGHGHHGAESHLPRDKM